MNMMYKSYVGICFSEFSKNSTVFAGQQFCAFRACIKLML